MKTPNEIEALKDSVLNRVNGMELAVKAHNERREELEAALAGIPDEGRWVSVSAVNLKADKTYAVRRIFVSTGRSEPAVISRWGPGWCDIHGSLDLSTRSDAKVEVWLPKPKPKPVRRVADYGDFSEYEVRRLVAEYCMSVTLGMTGWGVSFIDWVELRGIARHDGRDRLIRPQPKEDA